ncbi:MAG TPA: DUF4442 domain-containing protein [Bacteriovoracaceae bacterium]|nr:DUF4442 domain-containing protein [Bacteriovoracaceae bacterium]
MKLAYKAIDYFLQNPSDLNLVALNKILTLGIPFNAPHGFKIKRIDDECVQIDLPHKKLNQNHLGGVHACAIATLGEFCAGLSILKHFGISQYRLIMSELNAQYTYQARKHLTGKCIQHFDQEQVRKDLEAEGKSSQTLKTIIYDLDGQEVAVVTTTWQIKKWGLVRTKPL